MAADPQQRAFSEAVQLLARELTGHRVKVQFFAREAGEGGLMEDALTDMAARRIRFNTRAGLRFEDPLEPRTFGVILHELAHLDTPLHDRRFVDRLQYLAGAAARLLAERGEEVARRLREG